MKIATWFCLAMFSATLSAAPPAQTSVETVLGPKAFREGDVLEITDVIATSPKLEPGDSLTVRGRYQLRSQEKASLCLSLTQTASDGHEKPEAAQSAQIKRGVGEFELKVTIKNRGVLHVTCYDHASGKPIGGVYFGTPQQMQAIGDWDVSYYLSAASR